MAADKAGGEEHTNEEKAATSQSKRFDRRDRGASRT